MFNNIVQYACALYVLIASVFVSCSAGYMNFPMTYPNEYVIYAARAFIIVGIYMVASLVEQSECTVVTTTKTYTREYERVLGF